MPPNDQSLPRTDAALQTALEAAHKRRDARMLVALYITAAERQPRAAAFWLTQAYVHALESGARETARLRARLVAMGAET